jgi:hypothetical protein
MASVLVRAFHGALDDLVRPQGSIVRVTDLRNRCAVSDNDAGLMVYPDHDHDHDDWNATYALGAPVDIYSWMLNTPPTERRTSRVNRPGMSGDILV